VPEIAGSPARRNSASAVMLRLPNADKRHDLRMWEFDSKKAWTWITRSALALPFAALWSFCSAEDWTASLPLLLFYFTLLINTYHSVRFFLPMPAQNASNYIVDTCLIVIYVLMALSIGRPVLFCFLSVWLFLLGTIRYSLLIGSFDNIKVLRRKIIIDLLGAVLCFSAIGGILIGYVFAATWMLTMIFCCANIYLLQFKPMYRL
jgi:hypothetical protein